MQVFIIFGARLKLPKKQCPTLEDIVAVARKTQIRSSKSKGVVKLSSTGSINSHFNQKSYAEVIDLLDGDWKTSSSEATINKGKDFLEITNESSKAVSVYRESLSSLHRSYAKCLFEGEAIEGNSVLLRLVNPAEKLLDIAFGESTLNSISLFSFGDAEKTLPELLVSPHSKVRITKLDICFLASEEEKTKFLLSDLTSDILVITPSYPALENKYLCGFVHSRLQAYKEAGIDFDTVCCHDYKGDCKYTFEGVDILRLPFTDLRTILRNKRYKKILVHFFDQKYALLFDSCEIGDAELYFWCHNPETRYWDSPQYTVPYFQKPEPLSEQQREEYRKKDAIIARYNKNPRVSWIFITEQQKLRSEETIGITFENYHIIPNYIDEKRYAYETKNAELRKKIFFVRRFDNIASYSIDVDVRCIVELSRRACFDDMEFNIYGQGDFYDELIEPLHKFSNVHLHPYFLSHEEIADVHKEHGIALYASRYDSQGVSADEAAMSGLAVVSSEIDAAKHFLPNNMGLLAEPENYIQYADILEDLYKNPAKFLECAAACHEKIHNLCRREETIEKEITLITQPPRTVNKLSEKIFQASTPTLSIVVPSYNVAEYLTHGISTLVNQKYANELEIIIVNDGSKDNTAQVAAELMQRFNNPEAPIILLIDKENGGHGSTINAGLQIATGKYFKVMDGDDWYDSAELEKLIALLNSETSDIVLMDYMEDRANPSELCAYSLYDFMSPGLQYRFDDICEGEYGFKQFGPIIATACFNTKMLQDTRFKLSEHCFYVDIEFDVYTIIKAQTIVYYPLNVYRYFIGRDGQSISKSSFIRNKKNHRKIISNVLTYLDEHPELSSAKRSYVINNLVVPISKTHYMITTEWQKDSKDFMEFDNLLSKWQNIYNDPIIATNFIKLHRKTKGKLLPANEALLKINEAQKHIRNKQDY